MSEFTEACIISIWDVVAADIIGWRLSVMHTFGYGDRNVQRCNDVSREGSPSLVALLVGD